MWKKIVSIAFCAFTFIQCSDHYTLQSGTFGNVPKPVYSGVRDVKINGKHPHKTFNLGYARGTVGNDKAFIEVK
jgi:hypothetical protein